MTKHSPMSILCMTLCWLALGTIQAETPRPNIPFIMSDDHAAHAIGAYGGRVAELNPTPTLDRLASEGTRLTNVFCGNSICVPSRATLMTGQYSHSNGITTLNGSLSPPRQTLAHEMNRAGFETAVIGKWHLGAEPAAFDHYCVLPGQGLYHNPILHDKRAGQWPNNEVKFPRRGYAAVHSSDVITDLSLEWLERREGKGERPFFLMHHFKAPHDDFENAERYDFLYDDVTIPEPESLGHRGNHGPLGQPQFGTSVGQRTSSVSRPSYSSSKSTSATPTRNTHNCFNASEIPSEWPPATATRLSGCTKRTVTKKALQPR